MAFRFRRSFKIAPGFRLNLSKSGISTSVGRRGAWFTIGSRGTRTTVGLPGTGISYTQASSATPRGDVPIGKSLILLLLLALLAGIVLGFLPV